MEGVLSKLPFFSKKNRAYLVCEHGAATAFSFVYRQLVTGKRVPIKSFGNEGKVEKSGISGGNIKSSKVGKRNVEGSEVGRSEVKEEISRRI